MLRKPRTLLLALTLVFVGLGRDDKQFFVGLGHDDKPSGKVSGTVTYGGKTVPVGIVTFIPEEGYAVFVQFKDGRYTADQVPTGPVTVTVSTTQARTAYKALEAQRKLPRPVQDNRKDKLRPPPMPGADMMVKVREEMWASLKDMIDVPEKYADPKTSGLAYTIQLGSQEVDIDLPKVVSKKEKVIKDKGKGP